MHSVSIRRFAYTFPVPKLWNETIDAHRRAVRDATLDTTAALIAKHGLRSVTMSQIAEETGIGRATLYKYFPDVESILMAWHERQVGGHLAELATLAHGPGDPMERLETVLETYAVARSKDHDTDLAALLHQGGHMDHAHEHLKHLLQGLLVEGAKRGKVRRDVPSDELASFCFDALGGATRLKSKTAVRRLVAVVMAGLR
jgi:AcrR family transcriptional regulator